MILYIENPKDATRKLLELINEFGKVAGYKTVEFTVAEQNKEKRMKRNDDTLRDLWDNIKQNNIRIIEIGRASCRERV